MKLKIGDSVKIREDLEKNVWYGKNTAVSSMIILAGIVVLKVESKF